ncbi:MAG: motility associated factor glycosyltransferase family protein [Spirochaetaceae bacterium]|nr:motility associated factor glycosyltransferase family protein [Spirochaetaceae bacterium]
MNSNLNSIPDSQDKNLHTAYLIHNCNLFNKRFPELARLLHLDTKASILKLFKGIPQDYNISKCKKNDKAYTLHVGSHFLHSHYDSQTEARNILSTLEVHQKNMYVFCGLGLGYHIELFLLKHTESKLVIVEPDIYVFLLFMANRKLDSFFLHKDISILVGISPRELVHFLQSIDALEINPFFLRSFETLHKAWYHEFLTIKQRMVARKTVNAHTAKKFFERWFKNSAKNFFYGTKPLSTIAQLENAYSGNSAIIFAGGPSLEYDIHILKHKLNNIIIIAVDTACRLLIANNIIPHFIITGDPQYVNFQHLQFVNLSQTVLVSEITIFTHALQLDTKKTLLFSQGLPLIDEVCRIIQHTANDFILPVLHSGGSVATTAYSFALFLGVKNIYFSGLDLSFVDGKTHFRGSTFEEKTHSLSTKLCSSHTKLVESFFSSQPFLVPSNLGKDCTIPTEKRMQLYGWWFESAIQTKPKHVSVFTFSKKGMYIPGILYVDIEDFIKNTNTTSISEKEIDVSIQSISPLHLQKKTILDSYKEVLKRLKNDTSFSATLLPIPEIERNALLKNLEAFLAMYT